MSEISKNISYVLFILFFAYFFVWMLYNLALLIVGILESSTRAKEDKYEDYTTLAGSPFTIPLSIILPAHNEKIWIMDSLKSILNQDYPEFEVIIVNDGSSDETLSILNDFLKLKSVDRSYTDRFQSGKIHEVFKSENYPNITVLSKSGGFKKAGAVNAGLNFVRYKYVCVIDADTVLEPDAFLKVMSHVQKDPERIIGIGSYFGMVNGFVINDGKIVKRSFSYNPLVAYQNLEYIRTFIGNRIAWSKYNSMPCVSGGFGIWRKDILMELGGYSTSFSSEDIELTFRAHDYIIKNKKKGYRIMMLPYYVGWTEGPSNIQSLILQRTRWQRVINETIFAYRHMMLNFKYKTLAFLTLPYFLLYEVFGIFLETLGIGIVTISWLAGALDFKVFSAFMVMSFFSQTLISLLSLLVFIRHQRALKLPYIAYLVLLSLLEFFLYRWILWIARLLGTYQFFKGVRAYEQYNRETR